MSFKAPVKHVQKINEHKTKKPSPLRRLFCGKEMTTLRLDHFKNTIRLVILKSPAFNLRVVNLAGCEIRCDPIDVTLRSDGPPCNFNFSLPHTDRWLYVENHGLTRIELVVNEKTFTLGVSGDLSGDANAYVIPNYGTIGFDLTNILVTGDNNFRLVCQGPPGSYANILLTDFQRVKCSHSCRTRTAGCMWKITA